jgi:quercetin 2,3-dioxygenase
LEFDSQRRISAGHHGGNIPAQPDDWKEGTMSLSVEEMNQQLPVANTLPGEAVPYYMASGEGARYEINGQLVTVIARAADTGGIFSAAYISGGMGAESPFVSHKVEHKTLYVFDGILHVWLPGESRILTPGDSVVIPPNTPHAYRMASHYTRFLNWMTPGGAEAYYERVGTPIDSHVPPVRAGHSASLQEQAEVGAEFGITFPDVERVEPPSSTTPACRPR